MRRDGSKPPHPPSASSGNPSSGMSLGWPFQRRDGGSWQNNKRLKRNPSLKEGYTTLQAKESGFSRNWEEDWEPVDTRATGLSSPKRRVPSIPETTSPQVPSYPTNAKPAPKASNTRWDMDTPYQDGTVTTRQRGNNANARKRSKGPTLLQAIAKRLLSFGQKRRQVQARRHPKLHPSATVQETANAQSATVFPENTPSPSPAAKTAQKPSMLQTLAALTGGASTPSTLLTLPAQAVTVRGKTDRTLAWTTVALAVFGIIAVYTASASQAADSTGSSFAYGIKQLIFVVLGMGAMWLCSQINFQFWRRAALPMTFMCFVLLVLTLLTGEVVNGSERWIMLPGGIQFQPSEFCKLAVVALMARALTGPRLLSFTLLISLGLIGAMILLVWVQPNLSMVLILSFITGLMLFVAGFPAWIFATVIPLASVGVVQKIQHTEYLMRRIRGWLDPWDDPMDTGYNLIQSLYAIGNGGILGRGLGHSVQKLYYLPFQHTDFIFAVICEELGMFGSMWILALYALLGWRGFTIAFGCASPFGQLLAFGLTAIILIQAAINISVTIGLIPVTGVTLPLISYGGTSVIVTLALVGILLNISRYRLKHPQAHGDDDDEDDAFDDADGSVSLHRTYYQGLRSPGGVSSVPASAYPDAPYHWS